MPTVVVRRHHIAVLVIIITLSAGDVARGADSAHEQHLQAPVLAALHQPHFATVQRDRESKQQRISRSNTFEDPLLRQRTVAAASRQLATGFPGSSATSSGIAESRLNAAEGGNFGSVIASGHNAPQSSGLPLQLARRNLLLVPGANDATSDTVISDSGIGCAESSCDRSRKLQGVVSREEDEFSSLHALENSIDQVIRNSRSVLTEIVNASSGNSRNSSSIPNAGSSNVTSAAVAAALLPLASSNMRKAASSPLIPAVTYYYKAVNGSEAMPLGLPVSPTPGLVLTRWVLSAWGVSNLSAPAGAVDSAMQRVEQLINNFTRMSPGQVQLTASVNVTFAYAFTGIRSWTSAATRAMKQAASDAAGGYDPSFINVLLEPPDFGVKTDTFLDSGIAPVRSVPPDQQVVFYPVNSNSGGSRYGHSRRMLRQLSAAATSNAPAARNQRPGVSNATNQSGWTRVWVSYQRLDPLNVTLLLRSLSQSCEGVDLGRTAALRGADITATPCGQHTQQLLQQAGLNMISQAFALIVVAQPMVSVNVRLAVGVTEEQAASSTDSLVALWLAQPRNIAGAINMSGLPDPIGPNALIKWIVTPEVWGAQAPPDSLGTLDPAGLSPGTIAGIVVGCAAFAAITAGAIIYVVVKRRKQREDTDKTSALSDTSSRRHRRRRNAKPRYLLPVLPQHPEAATATTASSSCATSDGPTDPAVESHETIVDPDQIRPAMKELGDSVTSAARFELDDVDEQNDGTDQNDRSASSMELEGPSSHGEAPSARQIGVHPVLAARAALLAEHQSLFQHGLSQNTTSVGCSLDATREAATNSLCLLGMEVPHGHSSMQVSHAAHCQVDQDQPAASGRFPLCSSHGSPVVQRLDDAADIFVKPPPGSPGTLDQTGPCTPPRTLPASRLQQSPDDRSGVVSPQPLQELTIDDQPPTVGTGCCDGTSVLGSIEGPRVLGVSTGVVSNKVSKSPFVCSYDFSQLAGVVPEVDAWLPSAYRHDSCKQYPEVGPCSECDVGLPGVGSITVSVTLDGKLQVLSVPQDK